MLSVPGVALCVAPLVAPQGEDLDDLAKFGNAESDPASHTRYYLYLRAVDELRANAGATHPPSDPSEKYPSHYGGQTIQRFAKRLSGHRCSPQLLYVVQEHLLLATGRTLPVQRYAHRPPR